MRVVLFYTSKDEKMARSVGWPRLEGTALQQATRLRAFELDENGRLAVQEHSSYGFRLPEGTEFLFTENFPRNGAAYEQVRSRSTRKNF